MLFLLSCGPSMTLSQLNIAKYHSTILPEWVSLHKSHCSLMRGTSFSCSKTMRRCVSKQRQSRKCLRQGMGEGTTGRFSYLFTSFQPGNIFPCKDETLICTYYWEDYVFPYFPTKESPSVFSLWWQIGPWVLKEKSLQKRENAPKKKV